VNRKKKLGLIAGSGQIPLIVCHRAKQYGYTCVAAGIKKEFDKKLKDQADLIKSYEVKDFIKVLAFFKKNNVNKIIFAGKIKHETIYSKEALGSPLSSLFENTKSKNPDEIVRAVFDYVEMQGIEVMDSSGFLFDLFCESGVLTRKPVSLKVKEEIEFGWPLAKKTADLEIGQTVVIKDKGVVAVEGMEGTDKTIERGGHIAGKDCVVIKVARTHQDIRIDQPTVGLNTVKSLINARCSALCIEAEKVLFLDKEKALNLAEKNRISIIARK